MKLFRYYLFILFLSTLPLISIFLTSDLPHTHDGAVHLPRMAAYYKALLDGQILPRWAGDLNYGYGLPLFNFIYHTPYLVASALIPLGINLVLSFKLNLAISYLLAGLGMFLFGNALFKDAKKALLVSVFYQFAPFRLVEMLIRGSLGEMYTYALFPLVLFGLTRLTQKFKTRYFLTTVASTLFLIISHNSISLMFFAFAALYLCISAKLKKALVTGGLSLFLGLLSASFYWLPALFEHKYTYGDLFMKDLFRQHFPPLINFFLPNFFNDPKLQTGGISVQIGIFHASAILVTLFFLWKNKIDASFKKFAIVLLAVIVISIFFMNKVSLPIWARVSLLRQFQFSWRLLSIISFTTALLAANYLKISLLKKNIYYYLLLFLIVFSTAYYWKPALGFDKVKSEREYWDYSLNTTYFGETDVIWSAGPAKQYPPQQAQVIEGKGAVTNIYKKSNFHTYQVNATEPVRIIDNTQYFPGWRVYVDNKKAPIEFQDQNWRGLITFSVPAGDHIIKVIFEKSPIQLGSEYLSLATLLILVPVCLFLLKKFHYDVS